MPKSSKTKYYAVKVGRDGPKIYTTWEECKEKVTRYPGAIHRSFATREMAEEWLSISTTATSSESKSSPSLVVKTMSHTTTKSTSCSEQVSSTLEMSEEHLSTPPFYSDSIPDITMSHSTEEPSFDNEGGDGYIPFDWDPPVKLSVGQNGVLNRVKEGKNIFFTGSAGTGKSVLLREVVRTLGGPGSPRLGITASTGIAAVNISGTTLHSWAGIGLGQESVEKLYGKIIGQKKLLDVLQRWRRVRSLIIDEISMIDGNLFDKLEELARLLRRDDRPFGGIQLILSGDFCQLPPVTGRDIKGQNIDPVFVFDSNSWNRCIESPVTLNQVFRQKDKVFVDALNSLRFGKVDSHTENLFRSLSRNVTYNDGIQPTEIFSTRAEVENANQSRLRALPGESRTYIALDSSGYDSNGRVVTTEQMNRLLERLISPISITLKVGAQVMLIKNIIQGELVNGSLGIVTRFASTSDARKEYISNCNTANSESRPWLGTSNNDGSAVEYEGSVWPVVKFTNDGGVLVVPRQFTILNADGKMEACREQVPIILAYALSVHKSQGQTLQRVKVDLKRVFERGQAYVALSRATSLDALQVLNFDPSKVEAHPRVLSWYGQESTKDACSDEMDNEEAIIAYYTV